MRKWKNKRLAAFILAAALIVEGAVPGGTLNTQAAIDISNTNVAPVIETNVGNNDIYEVSNEEYEADSVENEMSQYRNSGLPAHEDEVLESIRDFGDRDTKSIQEFNDNAFSEKGALTQSVYIPELSKVPHLRNQDPHGTCYAFSTIGAVEANMIKTGLTNGPEDTDLSERALAWFTTNTVIDPLGGGEGDRNYYSESNLKEMTKDHVNGGNPIYTSHVLASWTGATAEEKAPYDNSKESLNSPLSVSDNVAYDDFAHIQNWYRARPGITMYSMPQKNGTFIVDKQGFADGRDTLKEMILKCGGATLAYSASDEYIGSDGYSYYNYKDRNLNHFVTVIGWDDNYSKNKFDYSDKRPEGNGAWLCKQSWMSDDFQGDSILDEGNMSVNKIFWISYYDTSIIESYAYEVEGANNYDNNYQYDLAAQYEYLAIEDKVRAANIFTTKASDQEMLEAVSFGTNAATNLNYTVKIYVNPTDESNPESGTLIEDATTEGMTSFIGYYTVKLNNKVFLKKGDTFAAVVELEKPGSVVGFKVEAITYGKNYEPDKESWYQSDVKIEKNQSFVGSDEDWTDVKSLSEEMKGVIGNVDIKAFTTNYEGEIPTETKYTIDAEYTGNALKPGDSIKINDFNIYKDISTKKGNDPWITERVKVQTEELSKVSIEPAVIPEGYKADVFKIKIKYTDSEDVKVKYLYLPLETVSQELKVEFVDEDAVYTYTGAAIKPLITVKYCIEGTEKLLRENVDYTVAYVNNTNAGSESAVNSPKIVVKGKNIYAGEIAVPFTIYPKDITDTDVLFGDMGLVVSSKEQRPLPTVKYGKKSLVKNDYGAFIPKNGVETELKDMSITYLDADKNVVSGNVIPKDAKGTYYVHVKGTNNYTGEKDIELKVGKSLLSKATVKMYADNTKKKIVKSYQYTGKKILPVITVTANGKTGTEGIDYTLTALDDCTSVGTHYVVIKSLKDDVVGTKTISYTIEGTKLSKAIKKILPVSSVSYTGNSLTPRVLFSLNKGYTLTKNSDYTVKYTNNVNAGTATVTLTGINGYTGSMSAKFRIVPMDATVSENKVEATVSSNTVPYTKGGAMPEVSVVRNGNSLVNGVDYTISYRDNKALTTTSKKAKYTVTFKGNYKGKLEGTFDIEKATFADLSAIPLQFAYDVLEGKPAKSTKITLYDFNEKQLSAGTDYEKQIEFYSGEELREDQLMDANKVPDVKLFYAVVTGKGNYDNTRILLPVRVVKYDIAKVSAKTKPQQYAGVPVLPTAAELIDGDVTVKIGNETKKLKEGTDYSIVAYINADKMGTAKAVIEGMGDFGGRKVINYSIKAKNLKK